MGIYLNPRSMSKEQWLQTNGVHVPTPSVGVKPPEGRVYVVLVKNPSFSAAGIAYDQAEQDYFVKDPSTRERDGRWFLVSLEKLREEGVVI